MVNTGLQLGEQPRTPHSNTDTRALDGLTYSENMLNLIGAMK